jgi:hypothetical protein
MQHKPRQTLRAPVKVMLAAGVSLFFLGGLAVAQTADQKKPTSGAMFLLDRTTGKGKIEIRCAEADSTRQCVDAVQPILSSGGGSGVAYATTSIKCGSTVYEVSTGTKGGSCTVDSSNHSSVDCKDGLNTTGATCSTGCSSSSGSGSCTIKSVP